MISESLIQSVKMHEGLRLQSYKDSVGVWTIGYGRNLQEMKISVAQAEEWLREDLVRAEFVVSRGVTFYHQLTPARQEVLVEMAYNLGYAGLLKFKRFFQAIEVNDYKAASAEMLDSKWARQVGKRANRLAEKFKDDSTWA